MVELYCGDCLIEMNNIKDHSVDLILCDLPYGTTDRKGVENKGDNRVLGWDTIIPLDKLWTQYRRILKTTGCVVLTADQPFTSQLVVSNIEWFKYEWIWTSLFCNSECNSRWFFYTNRSNVYCF